MQCHFYRRYITELNEIKREFTLQTNGENQGSYMMTTTVVRAHIEIKLSYLHSESGVSGQHFVNLAFGIININERC